MSSNAGVGGGPAATLSPRDFQSDQEVRWCPGCGDYAILKAMQNVLPRLGLPRERFVFVSGIGCSSRFPYYMDTYGFHTIHGRAFPIATGIKLANPELSVWIVTGDGDALSIGGNHFIHLMRRNIDVNVILFNNRIYGLTKGQTSPTSEIGKLTKSTPYGNAASPFNPIALALGSGATFVARSVDIYGKHLQETLERAARHRGSSFVEIYQNCNIFNDGAFEYMTDKAAREEQQVELIDGQPLVFGKNRDRGILLTSDLRPEVVTLGGDVALPDLIVHREAAPGGTHAHLLSQLTQPGFPTPIGVFRAVEAPTFESVVHDQLASTTRERGPGRLRELLATGDLWTVE